MASGYLYERIVGPGPRDPPPDAGPGRGGEDQPALQAEPGRGRDTIGFNVEVLRCKNVTFQV
eukprot:9526424-Prorocentrum_lima.AAC.1